MIRPDSVRIVEVGPRDGLQNETQHPLSPQVRARLIERLTDAGVRHIEAGSFVSPRKVPPMAHTEEVLAQVKRRSGVRYSVLTPNLSGFAAAVKAGVDEVAVFTAASESFCQHNINCSIRESLSRFAPILEQAAHHKIPVRGYVSTAIACPYEGDIKPAQVAAVTGELIRMGCYEVSLGDTIGVGTPASVRRMLAAVTQQVDVSQLAAHFHDTYGQALANIYTVLNDGIRVFDTSVAGLGGCPYAPGASGNMATEDLVYMLEGMGMATGINLDKLAETGRWISAELHRQNQSRTGTALAARQARSG